MTEKRPNPSEYDVDFESGQTPAGTVDPEHEPVGRVAGQDAGYAGETGADARAAEDDEGIGGAAGGRT